jgi:hypothetical protein
MGRYRNIISFCDDLVFAGQKVGGNGCQWRPFISRKAVKEELEFRGYELCEDGANHDPSLKRYFASPKAQSPYKGTEHDCAPRAVEQVRAFGGVLEHPAESLLWAAPGLDLPRPGFGDSFGGYTIEVDQVEFGHVARKRTWIYCVGVPSILDGVSKNTLPLPPFPGRQPTHWASGGRTASSRTGGAVPPGMKVCSAQQRRRTPVAFAEWLISLAESADKSRAA